MRIPAFAATAGLTSYRSAAPDRDLVPVADSRRVTPGATFFACAADETMRARHIDQALAAGAICVVSATPPAGCPVPVLLAVRPRAAWALASAVVHDLDRRCPPLVAVTGTKGKTTTAWCAAHLLGPGAAYVGTVGWRDGRGLRPVANTTPGPDELHPWLAALGPACPGVALEASSIGLDQDRLAGLGLRALAHTGLGRDHLDYHHTAEAYAAAKLAAIELVAPGGRVVVNADDPACAPALTRSRERGLAAVGLGFAAGEARILGAEGAWRLAWRGAEYALPMPMPGRFNAFNAACALLLAEACGVAAATASTRLADLPLVPGRMELLHRDPVVYVDYAHTAESISAAIAAVRARHPGRLVACVFGCGGDRDRGKRGPMGLAALAADLAVLTNDNSRSEDPLAIAEDVFTGLPDDIAVSGDGVLPRARMVVEMDRGNAIRLAVEWAGSTGVVLVCGKGHEDYQEIRGVRHPWSDRDFVRNLHLAEGAA